MTIDDVIDELLAATEEQLQVALSVLQILKNWTRNKGRDADKSNVALHSIFEDSSHKADVLKRSAELLANGIVGAA